MNEKFLAILQLVASGVTILEPEAQAAQFAKIIGEGAAAYKAITGKPVDEALIKEYEPIT